MTMKSPVQVAAMQASLTVKFSADPVTAQRLADKISRQLQKIGVSAAVTLEFGPAQNSAAGGA